MFNQRFSSYSLNPNSERARRKSRKNSLNQSSSSLNASGCLSLPAAQTYLQSTASNHTSYSDDFNASFLSVFRETDCFQSWHETNRTKLENNLFGLNSLDLNSVTNEQTGKSNA